MVVITIAVLSSMFLAPDLYSLMIPFILAVLPFCLLMLFGEHVSNLLLCLNHYGRMTLSRSQRIISIITGIVMCVTVPSVVGVVMTDNFFLFIVAVISIFWCMITPILADYRPDHRQPVVLGSIGLALVCSIALIVSTALGLEDLSNLIAALGIGILVVCNLVAGIARSV